MEKIVLDPHSRTMSSIFHPADLDRLKGAGQIVWAKDEPMPEEAFQAERQEAAIIITGRWRYGTVQEMPKLRAIIEVSGRHPSPAVLDYDSCFSRGIRVLSCAPAFAPSVAEMALAHALASLRNVVGADRAMREGTERWGFSDESTLYDQTVGFIGCGNLARALHPLLEPFRCRIQAYDPWLPDSYLQNMSVTPVSLDSLLESSKVIFVLAIPSKENRALLSRKRLSRIGKGSVLVLISRAHLVDFDALLEMVAEGRFKAAIDVFPKEPPPADHRVRSVPNVVLTPHLAGAPGRINIGRLVADDVEAIVSGLPPSRLQVAQPEFIKHLS